MATGPAWASNLIGLIIREIDPAIKHVGDMMSSQGLEETNPLWKPKRQLITEQALERYTKPTAIKTLGSVLTPAEDEPTCPICSENLTSTETNTSTLTL